MSEAEWAITKMIAESYMAEHYTGKAYTIRKGNNCAWVSHGRCEMYIVVRDGQVVDVIYD